MDPDEPRFTQEDILKIITEQKARATALRRGVHIPDAPNRTKQRKAKKLADAMRKRQRGCKQRTGIKPRRK